MKRLIKKAAAAAGLDRFLDGRSEAGIILGFHQVDGHDGGMLSQRVVAVSSSKFEESLRYLQSLGYSFVSLSEIVNDANRSKKVAITFDDGFRSVYVNAFPILRKFQAPFTVFLTTAALGAKRLLWLHRIYAAVDRLSLEDVYHIMGRYSLDTHQGNPLKKTLGALVSQESPDKLALFANELASKARLTAADEAYIAERIYLRPDEVERMVQDGMIPGAHGHNHLPLETLDSSQTEAEIGLCKESIQKAFGVQAVHYALPYGRPNPYVRSALERLGFDSLCTVEPGLVRGDTNLYNLPRLMDEADVLDLAGHLTLLHLQQLAAV